MAQLAEATLPFRTITQESDTPPVDAPSQSSPVLADFLLWCSGISWEVLHQCPEMDRIRQAQIGGFVCLTAMFAFCTSAYALYAVAAGTWIILSGASLWAYTIFSLDRLLVSTTSVRYHQDNFTIQLGPLLLRGVLAGMIGIIISTPLQLFIFRTEIDEYIKKEARQKIQQDYTDETKQQTTKWDKIEKDRAEAPFTERLKNLDAKLKSLVDDEKKELTEREKEIARVNDRKNCEYGGTCGSGRRGTGSYYEALKAESNQLSKEITAKRKEFNRQKAETEKEKRELLEEQAKVSTQLGEEQSQDANTAEQEFQRKLKEIEQKPQTLLKQHEALWELQRTRSGVRSAFWFLTFLFFVVEVLPVCAKFLMGYSTYDLLTYQTKYTAQIFTREKISQLESRLAQEESRRQEEQSKIEQTQKERQEFQELYQATLTTFRKQQEEQFNKTLANWDTQGKTDEQIQHLDLRFRDYMDYVLAKEQAFFTRAATPGGEEDVTSAPPPPVKEQAFFTRAATPRGEEVTWAPRPPVDVTPPPSTPVNGATYSPGLHAHAEPAHDDPPSDRTPVPGFWDRLDHWRNTMITKMFDQSIDRTIDFIAKHVLVEWGLLGVLASVVTQSLGSSMALFSVPILAVLVLLPRRLRAVRA